MSDKPEHISDDFLNAFVDGQLVPEEKAEAYKWISEDKDLNTKVCEIRKVRDLVQLAYNSPPVPLATDKQTRRIKGFNLGIRAAVAASITLILGIVLGWQLNFAPKSHDSVEDAVREIPAQQALSGEHKRIAEQPHPATMAHQGGTTDGPIKILVHLNSGDPAHIKEVLDDVEGVLQFYKRTHQEARVELVTNGEGLSLLRMDSSPYPERVKRMREQYENLTFLACQNSIDRLKEERGIIARLIPGTVVIDSGVAQIMRRQRQGWAYIRA